MRLRTANVLIAAFMIIALSSCRLVNSILHDDDVVAKVGSMMLYRSEVTRLIPDGTPSEDSLRLALQYINTWASDMVFLEVPRSSCRRLTRMFPRSWKHTDVLF